MMYVNIVISLLGLIAVAPLVIANDKQQCKKLVDKSTSEHVRLKSKQPPSNSDSSINVTNEAKWNSVIVGNKSPPGGNLSDTDEFLFHGMHSKFPKRTPEIVFMENEDRIKIDIEEAGT